MALNIYKQLDEIDKKYLPTTEVGDFTLNQEPQFVPLSSDTIQSKKNILPQTSSTIPIKPEQIQEDILKQQAQQTIISERVLAEQEYLNAPMTKSEEWALRMADKTWMPWGWEAFLRSNVKRKPPVSSGVNALIEHFTTSPITAVKSAGYLTAGAVEGIVKVFNTVYGGVSKVLRKATVVPATKMAFPFPLFVASLPAAMQGKEWNKQNITEALSQSINATEEQMAEMLSRVNLDDPQFSDMLPPIEEIREEAFRKLQTAKTPLEKGTILAEAFIKAFPAGTPLNKAFTDTFSDPTFILWYMSGRINAKPPVQVTSEGVAKARKVFGLGEKYTKAQVEKVYNERVNVLMSNIKTFAKDRVSLAEIKHDLSELASARSYLLNTTTDINVSQHTNMFQRMWAALQKPVLGEVAPKYPVIPFKESMTFNQASNLKDFMNKYGVSDEWLNYQSRMATGVGKTTIEKFNSGMNIENLDKVGAEKLLTRLDNLVARFPDDFVNEKPVLFDKYTEIPDIAKRLPSMDEIIKYVNEGQMSKAIQEFTKQGKGLFNMRAIIPELYSSAMDGNITASRLSSQSITQLNKIFTDRGIYKDSKLSKIIYHATSKKNPDKYLMSLYNKGTITLQEYKNAASATKDLRHFYDEWAKIIEPIAKRYNIKFIKEQRYQPQYIVKTLQNTLNQAKSTKYMMKELQGGWVLNDVTIGDASLPTSLQQRIGSSEYIEDAIAVAERYAHSMSKWVGLQPFDDFAQQMIPQLPKNLQPLAVKYVKHMRGYPGAENKFLEQFSKGMAKYEYWKWVGYSIKAMAKNAIQTIHDLASLKNQANYLKAWQLYNTPEGKKIIEEMGLQYVNIARGNFVGKSNILQKVKNDWAYYLWQNNQLRNYSIAGLSHYYDAIEQGFSHSQALQYGLQHGIQTQYAYNRAGSLIIDILQPTAGRFFLFKKWPLSQAQMFTEWATTGNKLAIARYLMEVDILATQMEKLGVSIRPGFNAIWNIATRGPLQVGIQEAQEIWKTIQLVKEGKKPIASDLVSQFINTQLGKFMKFYEESQWDWRVMDEMGQLTKESSFKDSVIDLLYSSSERANYWEEMKKLRIQDMKNQRRVNITKIAFEEWINSIHFNINPEKWDEKALKFLRTVKQQGIEIGVDIPESYFREKMKDYPKNAFERFWNTIRLRTKIQYATGQM